MKMPTLPRHTTLRVISILLVLPLTKLFPNAFAWQTFVFSLGFSHYAMALYYSKHQAARVLGQPSSYLPLVIITVLGGALYWRSFSLVLYFAAHHMFNEVYLMKYSNRVESHPGISRLRTSSLLLNLFVYLVILRDHRDVRFLDPMMLYDGLALSIISFVYCLMSVRPSMTRHELADASAFELIGLLLVGLSFFTPITFLQIVCYHFAFWIVYPMKKIRAGGNWRLAGYLGWTAGLTAFFFALSPIGALRLPLVAPHFSSQFMMWSYIHITISYALSASHPGWITRWFKPRQAIPSSALS